MVKEKEKLECPSCQSTNTKLIEKYKSNGILGPGCRTWVTDSYYSCLDCGVRFDRIAENKDHSVCSGCDKRKITVDRYMFDGMCAECTDKSLYDYEFSERSKQRNEELKGKLN